MNICQAINCPFANLNPTPPRSSGCTRYSVSNHCHIFSEFKHKLPELRTNQYWLFADGLPDDNIAYIKYVNEAYIAQDESSQFRLERMADESP